MFAGPGRIEWREDVADPRIEAGGDAILAVRLTAICGSDLHPYEGREPAAAGVVPGHEAVGEVVDVGPDVRSFRRGDRVLVPFSTSCGRCDACGAGLSARCRDGRLFGWAPPGDPALGLHGTQAEYVRVPLADTTLVRLTDELTAREGILLADNFTTGWYGALGAGESGARGVAVVGCGAVGLSAIAAVRFHGAGRLLAVDPVDARRAAARRVGATDVAAPAGTEAYHGAFAHVVEAVGSAPARRLAVDLCGPGATIASIGVPTTDFGFPPAELYDRNLTWRSGRCPVRSLLPDVLDARRRGLVIPVDELAPGPPRPLAEGPAAYARFASRADPEPKPLLAP